MKVKHLSIAISILAFLVPAAFGQRIVIHDPTLPASGEQVEPPKSIAKLYETKVLPPVRKKLVSDGCPDSPEYTGSVEGAFTRPNSVQMAVFYQFCQTGNGLGWVGLAIIEKGKVVSSFVQDSGWALSIEKVLDVNRNGLDEIVLEFGGGMHQGEGGTGVSIYEFKNDKPVELGWYQSSKFDASDTFTSWKLTAKPGKTPVFYNQKYISTGNDKWRRSGANKVYRLKKLDGDNGFEEVK